jgi:hypothetical protein
MKKRPYKKPEVKEVKLTVEDTLLTACRSGFSSRINPRRGSQCNSCKTTYRNS